MTLITRNHKQILVIRRDLKMPKGKAIAQACHGLQLALFQNLLAKNDVTHQVTLQLDAAVFAWLFEEDYTKICVSVNSEEELLALHHKIAEAGIRCALVWDNGHTQFSGVKTLTALAIGPARSEVLDPFTKTLPLYT